MMTPERRNAEAVSVHTHHRGATRLKGFTLVELLVVIAIIAVLIALLMPGLQKAKSKALSATCKSHLRQITAAALAYSSDHDGLMPTARSQNGAPRYLEVLQDYLSKRGSSTSGPSVWVCPAAMQLIDYRPSFTYSENFMISSEGQNLTRRGERGRKYHAIHMSLMTRPGKNEPNRWPVSTATIPYFMDGSVSSTRVLDWRHWRSNPPVESYYPHEWACNMSFLDGHVEPTKRWEGIWGNGQPTGRLARPQFDVKLNSYSF